MALKTEPKWWKRRGCKNANGTSLNELKDDWMMCKGRGTVVERMLLKIWVFDTCQCRQRELIDARMWSTWGGFDAPKRVNKWVKSRKSHAIIAFSLTGYSILHQYSHIYESLLWNTLFRCKTVCSLVFVQFSYPQRQSIRDHVLHIHVCVTLTVHFTKHAINHWTDFIDFFKK